MAILIKTNNASGLVAAIKKEIDDGKISTWTYDKEGDFTHTPTQWVNKAWLRPSTDIAGELKVIVIPQKDVKMTKVVSGVYQGRFIEMLVMHFEAKFTSAAANIP